VALAGPSSAATATAAAVGSPWAVGGTNDAPPTDRCRWDEMICAASARLLSSLGTSTWLR
jgi:hypothetical protein